MESAGRVTAAVVVVVVSAVEESESKVKAGPVLKFAGMTEGEQSQVSVIVVGLAAVVRVPVVEQAALGQKEDESNQAGTGTLAGPEKDPATGWDPGTGRRETVLTVIVESGNMEVGPDWERGAPATDHKSHSGPEGHQRVAGNKEAESLVQWRTAGGMKIAVGLHEGKGPVVHSSHLGFDHNRLGHAVHSPSAVHIAFHSRFQ